jgi:two-component system sensor histidine kinase AtoS
MESFASLIKRQNLPNEFDFILNQLPQAALIWDTKRQRITSCNGKLIELTGKTKQELLDTSLPDIFPNIPKLTSSESTPDSFTIIITKSGQVTVRIQIAVPAGGKNWLLVKLEPEKAIQQKEVTQSLQDQRWEALHVLALAPLHENLDFSFRQSLQAGQLLTGAGFLGVYLPSPDAENEFNLSYSWGNSGEFPKKIPISEISHLRVPFIWQPGTRSTSVLHQKALANKLTYLATSPIDQSAPLTGILMVGDQISQPPTDLIQMLQVLTGVLDTSRYHFSALGESQHEQLTLSEKLNVSELIKNIIADGIILVDHEYQIVEINHSASATLGYKGDEVLGKPVDQILIGEQSINQLLNEHTQESGNTHDFGEVRLHRRDGVPILINLRMIRLASETQQPAAAILLSDLSKHEEFRLRSKQLEEQAVLGEVMAIFAHEVRNPINNIGMGLQVMAASFAEDDPLQSEIGRMKQDIDRLEDLMKSVLSVSRSTEYKMKPVNVKVLLESILSRWAPRMGRYRIEAKMISPENVPDVKGDKRALEQVFTNIIQNGINSMKAEGGTLSIRITPPKAGELLTIDMIDTGLGIPSDVQNHIFDPFFTTNADGTGLGLAISKRIVVAHSGQLELVESFPGGTVFRIGLPVV